jgi:hypothetical protein
MHFSSFAVIASTGDTVSQVPTVDESPPPPHGNVPARFSGENLTITPSTEELWRPLTIVTRTGNTVSISATVQNTGEEAGVFDAELVLNGKVVGNQEVMLQAGETKQVRFVVSRLSPGDYRVQLAGLTGTFTSSQQITWWLIAVLGSVVIGIAGYWLLQRRRRQRLA